MLSLATTIMALMRVLCRYITSFNYGGKEARDADFTCWCHLSNIMFDSILNDSMDVGEGNLFFLL